MAEKADLTNKVMLARVAAMNLTLLNVSRLMPRSRKRWVFGHQAKLFAGNSKYLFLWMHLHRPDIAISWITHDDKTYHQLKSNGLPCHRRWSVSGVLATMRSRFFIFCHGLNDINSRLSKGALLINLWHGVGIKTVMFGDKRGIMHDYRRNWTNWLGRLLFHEYVTLPDVLVTTSDFMQRHFSEQFELPPDRCPMLGYPRLDVATDPTLRRLATKIDESDGFFFNKDEFAEVYLYMPTHRDTHRSFIETALPDLETLTTILSARNAVMYVKLHPWTLDRWPGDTENIRLWPRDVEVYTYLDLVTCLITDYSSILYDFLFIGKSAIVLYTFDHDRYLAEDHAVLYPFEENTVGVRVPDTQTLYRLLESGDLLEADERADMIREKFWGRSAQPASPAIVSYLEAMVT